jgi:predicted membrane chloride channel (bestrophin family)
VFKSEFVRQAFEKFVEMQSRWDNLAIQLRELLEWIWNLLPFEKEED